MIGNYLVIAYRNLLRSKAFSFINILGLAVGLAAAILVAVYVTDELSYDQFHSKGDRIYRLSFSETRQDELFRYAKLPFPVKSVLTGNIPEIESITRLYNNTSVSSAPMIHVGDDIHTESGFWFAEPGFFDVFDFELISGDPKTALTNSHSVILTRSTARKYFGTEDPLGREIGYYKSTILTVTGIVEDPPRNSHVQFDLLAPIELLRGIWVRDYGYDFEKDWKWNGSYNYALVRSQADISEVETKLPALVEAHFREIQDSFNLELFPFDRLYLSSPYRGEMGAYGSMDRLYAFSAIAMIILFVACINFMNLATARSAKRAREVGIRKVLGAHRKYLVFQFLGESSVISVLALAHALLLVNLSLPLFNHFAGKSYSMLTDILTLDVVIFSMVVTMLVGLMSGIYPAFFLSSFQPIRTLRNDFKTGGNISLRKTLVVVQFAIAMIFMVSVIVIYSQLNYLKNKDLGYITEQTLLINNRSLSPDKFELFRQQCLTEIGEISELYHGDIPGKKVWGNTVIPEGHTDDEGLSVSLMYVGYDIVNFFDIELMAGRSFQRGLDHDSINARSSFIINRALAAKIGWSLDSALGREIHWIGGNNNQQLIKGRVVGIVDNFHYRSLYDPVKPLLMRLSGWGDIAIRFRGHPAETIRSVQEIWTAMHPTQNFDYTFLDNDLYLQYEKEQNLASLVNYFTVLAIFISVIGLFGLVSFSLEQRRREFALRKILGAGLTQLAILLGSQFGKLILVACLIGIPFSWMALREWLNGFAYSITITPYHFLMAIGAGLLVSLLTMMAHMVGISKNSPSESLRIE